MRNFVVIGSGPAGSTIAALLSKAGKNVLVFDEGLNRELYVGESLIPAVMPILQKLGVEEEVKKFSVFKPGATVWLTKEESATAKFDEGGNTLPGYAYNTPRVKFDQCIKNKAVENGAHYINLKADVEFKRDVCFLKGESLDKANEHFQGNKPDFIIDASGRKRLLANKAKLLHKKGKRKDIALFAHVEGHKFKQNYGDIHMHRADKGWCWRIPLKDKTSVGIVMNKEHWENMGANKEERFDRFIQTDSELSPFLSKSKRVTQVQQYSNYQMESHQFYGKNWVLIGDAAGFLDPVFSSGLYLSMFYADKVAGLLTENESLSKYQKAWKKEVKAWKKMIEIWYNGRLFTTYRVGQGQTKNFVGKTIEPHIVKHFTSVFTGEAVKNNYSISLLEFMTGGMVDLMRRFKMHDQKLETLAIH